MSRSNRGTGPRAARALDVVVYGASGFVGQQVVAYLARHAPAGLRWAVAGRNEAKLRQALAAAQAPEHPVLVAEANDRAALAALAGQTQVVLSLAGPYALYGSALVAACVAHGTHYVDITGETPWVRDQIDLHHERAAAEGIRIVPCCGFDSCPSDLGAMLVVQAMRQRHQAEVAQIKASHAIKGGVNGGTIASMVRMLEAGQEKRLLDPFLLNPAGTAPADTAAHDDPFAPHHDDDFDAWLGPFVMGPINTRVVRRSAALLGYGPAFCYQEYMRFGRGPAAAVAAAGFSAASVTGQGMMKVSPMRKLITSLASLGPAPGQGPSVEAMDGGFFRCDLIGRNASGQTVRAQVSDQGDPGNRATTKFVCESALALVLDADQLPDRAGVLTPASAFGDVLVERLRAAGMTLRTEP